MKQVFLSFVKMRGDFFLHPNYGTVICPEFLNYRCRKIGYVSENTIRVFVYTCSGKLVGEALFPVDYVVYIK